MGILEIKRDWINYIIYGTPVLLFKLDRLFIVWNYNFF